MLMTHYRQPIDWTVDRIQEAQSRLTKWLGPPTSRGVPEKGRVSEDVVAALQDDMNTTEALSALDELAARVRSPEGDTFGMANDLAASMKWLGIARDADFAEARADSDALRDAIRAATAGLDLDMIQKSIAGRNAARKAKDFKESDRIRDELLAKGIVLKDGPTGTTWEVKR
jgi:cysteinyl-tRNA synthetase